MHGVGGDVSKVDYNQYTMVDGQSTESVKTDNVQGGNTIGTGKIDRQAVIEQAVNLQEQIGGKSLPGKPVGQPEGVLPHSVAPQGGIISSGLLGGIDSLGLEDLDKPPHLDPALKKDFIGSLLGTENIPGAFRDNLVARDRDGYISNVLDKLVVIYDAAETAAKKNGTSIDKEIIRFIGLDSDKVYGDGPLNWAKIYYLFVDGKYEDVISGLKDDVSAKENKKLAALLDKCHQVSVSIRRAFPEDASAKLKQLREKLKPEIPEMSTAGYWTLHTFNNAKNINQLLLERQEKPMSGIIRNMLQDFGLNEIIIKNPSGIFFNYLTKMGSGPYSSNVNEIISDNKDLFEREYHSMNSGSRMAVLKNLATISKLETADANIKNFCAKLADILTIKELQRNGAETDELKAKDSETPLIKSYFSDSVNEKLANSSGGIRLFFKWIFNKLFGDGKSFTYLSLEEKIDDLAKDEKIKNGYHILKEVYGGEQVKDIVKMAMLIKGVVLSSKAEELADALIVKLESSSK